MDNYTYYYDEYEHRLYIYDDGNLVKVENDVFSAEEAREHFEEYLDKEAIIIPTDGLTHSY